MEKVYNIISAFATLEDYINSDEFNSIFEGYAPSEKNRRVGLMKQYPHFFSYAFSIKADPRTNYGKNYKLLRFGKTSDGLSVAREETAGSMMDASPWMKVGINRITDEIYLHTDVAYTRDKENRRALSAEGAIVTTEIW